VKPKLTLNVKSMLVGHVNPLTSAVAI